MMIVDDPAAPPPVIMLLGTHSLLSVPSCWLLLAAATAVLALKKVKVYGCIYMYICQINIYGMILASKFFFFIYFKSVCSS